MHKINYIQEIKTLMLLMLILVSYSGRSAKLHKDDPKEAVAYMEELFNKYPYQSLVKEMVVLINQQLKNGT